MKQAMKQTGQERRLSDRISTTVNMQVYAYGMLVASGRTVEMSEHGLRLRIEQDYSADELDPGKHLDVMLDVSGRYEEKQWLPIRVVRKWDDGIAACYVGFERAPVFIR
jgi:hypothetical protein